MENTETILQCHKLADKLMTKKHAISDVCLNLMEKMIMRYMHFLLNKHHPLV